MVRVSTPLIESVQKLCELHRRGQTSTILQGLEELIAAVESKADITPPQFSIGSLIARVEALEQIDSGGDSNVLAKLTERLEKVESAIESISITLAGFQERLVAGEPVEEADNKTQLKATMDWGRRNVAGKPVEEADNKTQLKATMDWGRRNVAGKPVEEADSEDDDKPIALPKETVPEDKPIVLPAPFPEEGLSTVELSELVGVTPQQVNRIRTKGKLKTWKGGWRAKKINAKEHRYYPLGRS